MYSEEDLDSAVVAGVLGADAAAAFRLHVAQRSRTPAVDEEHFRLVTGFNDIFVVIAIALLLMAVSGIGGAVVPWLGAAGCAAVSWPLAEFFVLRRRMALPAIVLLLTFVGGVGLAIGMALPHDGRPWGWIIGALVAALCAWLHWRRFHVPITVAAGACALVIAVFLGLVGYIDSLASHMQVVILVGGLLIFALALHWDASDTARQTRRSDVAFWLHLAAAPLIVHPIFEMLGMFEGTVSVSKATLAVASYLMLAVVSVCTDRRALMVSALGYVVAAFTQLLTQGGFTNFGFALTALVIGSALLLLSAFWQRVRATVLPLVPATWRTRLAPLR